MDVDTQEAHHLSPLRVHVVGFQDMLAPVAVAALDETKHAQVVDIILQGQAIRLHERLRGLNMRPGGFLQEEIRKEELAAVIVDGGD